MMAIIRSIKLTKVKGTIIWTDAMCLSTQHWFVGCTNKLKCFETLFCDCFNQILLKIMCFYSIPLRHSFTFIWLKTYNFVSSWPFNRGMKQNQITLGTARSWPQPLNRGGRWIEVFITVYSSQFFRDFGHYLPDKSWPLNKGPLIEVRLYCDFLALLLTHCGKSQV